jgi:hypothetical protein
MYAVLLEYRLRLPTDRLHLQTAAGEDATGGQPHGAQRFAVEHSARVTDVGIEMQYGVKQLAAGLSLADLLQLRDHQPDKIVELARQVRGGGMK